MRTKLFPLLVSIIFVLSPIATVIAQDEVVDITAPNQVTGVSGKAGDAGAVLSWDETLDDTGESVSYYKIYYSTESIIENAGEFNQPVIETPDNEVAYTVANLENGTRYYFVVTAMDIAGNESIDFSEPEVILTPEAGITAGEVISEMLPEEGDPDGTAELFGDEDVDAPTVISAEAEYSTAVKIVFSKEVVIPEDNPEAAFDITEEFDRTSKLEVISVEVNEDDAQEVILETAEQDKDTSYTITVSAEVTDTDGQPIVSGITDTASFDGSDVVKPEEGELEELPGTETPVIGADTTPPEEVTNLLITFEKQIDAFLVHLRWTPSVNLAKDMFDQIIYTSIDRGLSYDKGTSLGTDAVKYDIDNMEGGKEFFFKITTKDTAGNESIGVIKSIRLPQTGPVVGGLLLISGLLGGAVAFRRKKR